MSESLMNQPSAFADEEIVTGHLPRGFLWLAMTWFVFGLAMGICAYLDAQMMRTLSGRITITSILLIFFWLSSLLCIWIIIHLRVVADKNGLKWRGLGGWKKATWMEVKDYYVKVTLHESSSKNATHTVETVAGKFTLKDLTHGEQLRAIVQEKARWAQAKTWEERGKSKENLELSAPETFTVDQTRMRDFWIMLLIAIFVIPFLMLFKANAHWNAPLSAYRSIKETWETLGALWGIGMILMIAFPSFIYGLILFASWPIVRESRRRRGQSLTVSSHGLIWHDSKTQREIQARWEEVSDFYVAELPGWVTTDARYVIETTRGNFDYVAMLNGKRLQMLVQKYCASRGLQLEWKSRSEHSQRTPAPKGATLHTYRQSEVRAMIWLVVAMMMSSWISTPMRILGLMPNAKAGDPSEWFLGLFMLTAINIAGAWLLYKYFRFQVLTDENGITQRSGKNSKFVAWSDVREYEVVASCVDIRSESQTIRFLGMIGAQDQLQKTIQTRAVHSKTRAW